MIKKVTVYLTVLISTMFIFSSCNTRGELLPPQENGNINSTTNTFPEEDYESFQPLGTDGVIYPGETWAKYSSPEEAGWSLEKLNQAKEYYEKMGSAAVMVVYDGAILVEWGNVEKKYECRSVRKSFLSALYGIHVDEGNIDINKTLDQLDIDDNPPLIESEKQSKVVDLLKARSGIYHAAAYEGYVEMPERGSHAPGTHWLYKNWDFNTLGTIFEQETKKSIFDEFKKRIADPLQMEDFKIDDTQYYYSQGVSIHPAYTFRMSARDMARFGLLYLRNGKWRDSQIISEKWINESTASYSDTMDI